ncbi:ATP-binding protein [Fournierella sp.]|uniref:ATP-binding protein n=1 Tax=Allofournierella sp. TaxID=1940256 RepID=UPI00345BC33A
MLHIRISLNNTGDWAELCVEDDGPGLLPEERERIFEPFYRLDRSRSREIGGNGLGLAIVRRITRQYGGTVYAEQSSLGGACFVVQLPFRKTE